MDFAPAFIDLLTVLRHSGYNAAYWNTATRHVAEEAGEVTVNGTPLVFFRFFGVVPQNAGVYSNHFGQAKQNGGFAI